MSDSSVERELPAALAGFLEEHDAGGGAACEPLAGDASTRRYFRLRVGATTRIVALYPEPFAVEESTFLAMRGLLADWSLPVPRIHEVDGARGIVVQDDLGDVSLQRALDADASGRDSWYVQALEQLARLHARSAADRLRRGPCFSLAFDLEKLTWELEYFAEHFLAGLRGRDLAPADRAELSDAWRGLCEEIASWPRVVCHRDFHSRNLMLHDGVLWWVDFQDARMGPDTYDLASLLRDSYVRLPDDFVEARVEAFRTMVAPDEPGASFRRRFELTCVQRSLKALGTFGFVAHVRGSSAYSEYVPGTLRSVRHHLERHPELAPLRRALARHLEELR